MGQASALGMSGTFALGIGNKKSLKTLSSVNSLIFQ
jgi:hypothetical protein